MPTEDRLLAYREVVEAELAQGSVGPGLASKLGPIRAALGISNRQHAMIEQTLRARYGGATRLVVGDVFLSRYEILEHLGTGGGGAAFLCRDTRIGRDVVVKAIGEPLEAGEPDGIVQEAYAFGSIDHPNVVKVHDVEQVGQELYLVLEHIPGGTLFEGLERGSLEPGAFCSLAGDLLSGLAAVHDAGLVHRDVKPANILVAADGAHKVADLGIAGREPGDPDGQGAEVSTRHTVAVRADGVRGTIPYMSPEQARGARVDRRSDLYSAAVVLWEAYTGQRYVTPEPGETATELQLRIAQADGFPRVPEDAPAELQAWFDKALAPDPAARFQTAEELLSALGTGLAGDS